MSTTMQLVDLRNAVRQRADLVNNQFVTDAELNSMINQSYFELYDLLVEEFGDNYFVAPPVTFQTDGTNDQYSLPDGTLYSSAPALLKLLGVDLALSVSENSYVTIKPFTFSERNRYAIPNFQNFYGVTNMRYRLNGSKIWFTPLPSAGQTLRLWYVPRLTTLSADSDTVDGVSGWTEYIIVDVAIKCLAKEESDASIFLAQKAGLISRIQSAAENRDAGSPPTVSDVRGNDMGWPGGAGGYGSGMY